MRLAWRTADSWASSRHSVPIVGASEVPESPSMSRRGDGMATDSLSSGSGPDGSAGGACVGGAESSSGAVDSATEGSAGVAAGVAGRAAIGVAAAGTGGRAAATGAGVGATAALASWMTVQQSAVAGQVIPFLGAAAAAKAAVDGDGDTTWEAIVSRACKERGRGGEKKVRMECPVISGGKMDGL